MDELANMPDETPILYSFRRCPYAMRASLAIAVSGKTSALREVVLRNKPPEMIQASPKGTVPVMLLPNGHVLEESLEIMCWALEQSDPEGWLAPLNEDSDDINALISENDGSFKENLDRYKYPTRYNISDPLHYRSQGVLFLEKLNTRLIKTPYLCGYSFTFADAAILPFVRQFANNDRKWFDALSLSGVQNWLQSILESERFLNMMLKYPVWKSGMDEPTFPDRAP